MVLKFSLFVSSVCLLLNANCQWSQMTSPYSGNLLSIKFIDQNIGFIGCNTAILTTTDGGQTWESTIASDFSINCFAFPSSSVGYYGANNNVVRKTTDQGANWTLLNPNISPFGIFSMSFLSTTTGYAVGNGGNVRRTTNGGSNWTTITTGTSNDFTGVHFFDLNTGVFIGENGYIRRTTTAMASWSVISSGTTNDLFDMHFVDANIGFIVGEAGTILKTTNGGANWSPLTSGTSAWLHAVCFKDALEGYVGGSNGEILKTTDGGATWQAENSTVSTDIRDIAYVNGEYFAVGYQSKLLTTGTVNSLAEYAPVENSFMLYPNPASNSVKLTLNKQNSTPSIVKIFNLTGEMVNTFTMTDLETTFDIENLVSGSYIVELLENGLPIRKNLVVN